MKYRDLESGIKWMINIAQDNTHGYSMNNRYGPNFDCSSFIAFALIFSGFNIRYNSVTSDLKSQLLREGWKETKTLKRGVIALREKGGSGNGHVAMLSSSSTMVHASGTNKGILEENFYIPKDGWDCYLYYPSDPYSSTLKSIDEIAREVIAGKWGNYPKRKELLESAGYNYDEVQKRVNELLGVKHV